MAPTTPTRTKSPSPIQTTITMMVPHVSIDVARVCVKSSFLACTPLYCIHVEATCSCIRLVATATLCLAQVLFLVATTCHGITPITPHALGIVPLCIASELILLLHIDVPHSSLSLSVALVVALHPWLTMSSPCIRHCAFVLPCYCPRSLMRLRCRPMRPECGMVHVKGFNTYHLLMCFHEYQCLSLIKISIASPNLLQISILLCSMK